MVAKDRNHPSVIMYSLGNEIIEAGTPAGAATGRDLAEKVRALDPTRYVTNGVNGLLAAVDDIRKGIAERRKAIEASGGINQMMGQIGEFMTRIATMPAVTTRTAESFAVLDVAGMNYLHGRYELDRGLFPNRVIVGTETAPPEIDRLWRLVLDNPHVLGDFTWTGYHRDPQARLLLPGDRVRPACTEEGYQAGAHTTFDGRALAVVRATGPGDITLAISSHDGLSATVTLTAQGEGTSSFDE
ncbi:MAG TPA: glycoside hydrolase family 2 TIM barrel-domain containing protein [Trebonia sp.]|nr:glycoside hydrolase family 2 TIM barrel-domain containing protein [Trebonia sp.]